MERLFDPVGRILRRIDPCRPLGQRAHDAELIGDFVQETESATDVLLRDLPDQRQHRRVAGMRGGERRRAVEKARARNDGVDLRLAGRHRRAERHIGGALFVPGVDDPDLVLLVIERVHQDVVLHAGHAVQRVDPVGDERGDDRLGGVELGHRVLSAVAEAEEGPLVLHHDVVVLDHLGPARDLAFDEAAEDVR